MYTANPYPRCSRTNECMESSTDRNETGRLAATEDSISGRVVTAVADAKDVDPLQLSPLYEAVDPDALERLFQAPPTGGDRAVGRVVFTIDGCEVVVHSDGDVDVTAPEGVSSAAEAGARGTERQPTGTGTD